jgi:hypothetical protein
MQEEESQMRKIVSKEIEEKKRKRNQLVIGGLLVLIMVASSLGYAFTREQTGTGQTGTDKIIYNGYEFTKISNLWYTTSGNYQFSFIYNPNETGKINSALNPIGNYAGKPLYIYSDDAEATSDIYRNLFSQNKIVLRMQDACLQGRECNESSTPVKNCTDNFVIIEESSNTGIKQQDNCVFIEGEPENLTMLTDSFLFRITGIQQNL